MKDHTYRDSLSDWTGDGYEPGYGDRRMEWAFGSGNFIAAKPNREVDIDALMDARDPGRDEW